MVPIVMEINLLDKYKDHNTYSGKPDLAAYHIT